MSLWSKHPSDDRLAALAEGRLSGRKRERVVEHARACARCAARHERLVIMARTLAGGRPHEPSDEELEALRKANRAAVLASARNPASPSSAQAQGNRWRLVGPLVTAAVVLLVGGLGVRLATRAVQSSPGAPGPSEFTPRGVTGDAPDGTLRVFCVGADDVPRALDEGATCPEGATLAFSARFNVPLDALRIEVHGGPSDEVHHFDVMPEPGRAVVLPFTLKLEGEGAREVQLHGGAKPLRQRVWVGPSP